MAAPLDKHDRAILELLLVDARTPAAQIAERIGLSRPAVAERVEKLERLGVLRGTTAVLDPVAMGLGVTAFVAATVRQQLDARGEKALGRLMRRPEVLEVHTVAGDDCYLLKIRTDSIQSLNQLVGSLATPPLSLSTRTTIVMQTHCEKVGGVRLGEQEP